MLVSASELVACEVTTPGTPGETVLAGMAELDSVPGLVAAEGMDSDSLWETLGVVWGKFGLVFAGLVTEGTLVSGSAGETVRVGTAELASVSKWLDHKAVVSGSCEKSVIAGKLVLVSAPELITSVVTTPDTSRETVVVEMAELTSALGLMAVEGVLSDPLWEKFGVVLETGVLVPMEWIHEAVVPVSPGETVKVGTMDLASVLEWVTHESVVSGSLGESVRVGKVILVSAPEMVASEVTSPGTVEETAGGGMAELVFTPG